MTFIRFSDTVIAGKRVFIRADLNVPQDAELNITDDSRAMRGRAHAGQAFFRVYAIFAQKGENSIQKPKVPSTKTL